MGLPLRMNNIHAPTVPSGPASAAAGRGNPGQLTFTELQRRKADMEAELKALGGVLDSHGADMNTPLTTRDGFPRADIDVAQGSRFPSSTDLPVRTTRARIIHLRNDYKDLMATIEKHLHEHFSNMQEDDDAKATPSTESNRLLSDQVEYRPLEEPFAKVNDVVPGSPAESAGLRPGDEIRRLGYVNYSNHDSLKKVAECVQGNEGQSVLVQISRPGLGTRLEMQLTLTPTRNWGGRGLLGCHIIPL
ncbi:26S proteasome non-ATPase regulatory subunit 9 [Colletotrichum musicola]|uniref:Probable 26S proteasome regulatory subunit p27 n=1 Tax=Colletotrichum musicola TaxID=2175873 RepID=A0A8H6NXM2_9PEZI|nr:26S proteasome non-ATPase regulatory subunit 9 [Colletotrichum musicola]